MKQFITILSLIGCLSSGQVYAVGNGGSNGGGGFCSEKGCTLISQVMNEDDWNRIREGNQQAGDLTQPQKPTAETPMVYWQPSQSVLDLVKKISDAQPLPPSEKLSIRVGVWPRWPDYNYRLNDSVEKEVKDGFGRVTARYFTIYEVPDPAQINKERVAFERDKYLPVVKSMKRNPKEFRLFAYGKPYQYRTVLLPDFFQIVNLSTAEALETQALTLIHESFQRSNKDNLTLGEVMELDSYIIANYQLVKAGGVPQPSLRYLELIYRRSGLRSSADWENCEDSEKTYYKPTLCVQKNAMKRIAAELELYSLLDKNGGPVEISRLMDVEVKFNRFERKYSLTLNPGKADNYIRSYPKLNQGFPFKELQYFGYQPQHNEKQPDIPVCKDGNQGFWLMQSGPNSGTTIAIDCETKIYILLQRAITMDQ